MSFKSQLSEVSKLGEPDPTYGVVYWGKVADDLTPIKFNSKNEHIGVGDSIEYEEKAMKKSAKGTEYWQLKKVHVVEQFTEKPVKPAENGSQLDRIEAKLDQLLGNDVALGASANEPEYTSEAGLSADEDAPLDLEDIPNDL